MKLISTNSELRSNFSRLFRQYPNIAFAVAWASNGTSIFEELNANSSRIYSAVIGTHFYQTHPDVLDAFVESKSVRFMLQPKGVFHPKIYVFWNEDNWEVLMGSANLTAGALNRNAETMMLISSSNRDTASLKDEIIELIESYWSDARSITKADAISYRALWAKQQPALKRLSGQYGDEDAEKPPVDSTVMSMTWPKFFKSVQADPYLGFENRLDLLKVVKIAFDTNRHFQDMGLGLRKTIAGLPNDFDNRWGWFGSMKGAGYFHQAVNNNNVHLSRALGEIPSSGTVLKEHYEAFIEEFVKAFPNGGHGIGVTSRLLALKRPDYFVCFDSKNKTELCIDFGIKQSGMDYESYWFKIVERFMDSAWWNEPRPTSTLARAVWDGRAAMLDAIFYRP